MIIQLFTLLSAGALAVALAAAVRRFAAARGIVDQPGEPRKIHTRPTPLLGGVAVFLAFTLTAWAASPLIVGRDLPLAALVGLTLGGFLLMVGGYLDDRYCILPRWQIAWPIAAALVAVLGGATVQGVTNPFGGTVHFDSLPFVPAVVGFLWLLGTTYTTKLLDGLDGLASGIGAIGALIIFSLTQFTPFYQPSVGLLALAFAGACLGFLVWNWYPARLFLGEGGSLYIGFVLGYLSIISGAKIATALLVVGIPALDVAWVIIRRLFLERKSVAAADRRHLHYRLLDASLSVRQAVLLLYALTGGFGLASLFLSTRGKLLALGALLLVMLGLGAYVVRRYQPR